MVLVFNFTEIFPGSFEKYLSPIFLLTQIQLMQLVVGSLVGKLYPSFCLVWYDLPTNSLTNEPTNNPTNWIWMSKNLVLYNI